MGPVKEIEAIVVVPHEYHKIRMQSFYELANKRFESAAEFGALALRSVLIANGGALAGLVTFVGSGSAPSSIASQVGAAFASFGLGLVFVLLSTAFAYFTQSFYARQDSDTADQTYYENLADGAKAQAAYQSSVGSWKWGGRCEWAAIAFFAASIISFCTGAIVSVQALVVISG